MTRFSTQYEEAYKPIFGYMVDPSKIRFEDDILVILKSFIKRTGRVSEVIIQVFPTLELVF